MVRDLFKKEWQNCKKSRKRCRYSNENNKISIQAELIKTALILSQQKPIYLNNINYLRERMENKINYLYSLKIHNNQETFFYAH
ncbi:hypothetical protein ALC60_02473 [Trachymyrmex zeteki]|uniref:Uncharacterized protein n=1 Tax=Mycetomoellerius zeteki TaxID=64791 RepID=A0A151XDU2_9HYME|nr:hypothetical protein ALC60_02473 [Trachymyrmex zeteki]